MRKWLLQDGNYVGIKVYNSACGYSDFYETFIPCDNFLFMMSPNPATDVLTISGKNTVTGKIYKVAILNKMGTIVAQHSFNGLSTVQVSVSNLPVDVYTVQVFNGTKWSAKKLQVN